MLYNKSVQRCLIRKEQAPFGLTNEMVTYFMMNTTGSKGVLQFSGMSFFTFAKHGRTLTNKNKNNGGQYYGTTRQADNIETDFENK